MTNLIEKVKPTNYSASMPYVEYGGDEVEVEVYIGDDLLTINVELEADNLREVLNISNIEAEMFDEDSNQLDTAWIDLENLVIEIFETNDTFAKAEMKMAEAIADYHA